MRLSTAFLADMAQVRNGMLFVLSGAISRMAYQEYPAQLGFYAALIIEGALSEVVDPIELRLTVETADGDVQGQAVAAIQGVGKGPRIELEPGELLQIPLAVPMHVISVPAPGRYCVRASIPEFEETAILGFTALKPT